MTEAEKRNAVKSSFRIGVGRATKSRIPSVSGFSFCVR